MNDIYGKHNLPTSVIANSADEKIFRFGMDNYWEPKTFIFYPIFIMPFKNIKTVAN